MVLLFTALLMLCGLGAPIFATIPASRRDAAAGWAAGFALTFYLVLPGTLPNPAWLGLFVAGSAALAVFFPGIRLLPHLCGGLLTALSGMLLRIQGVPLVAAFVVAVMLPVVAHLLAMRYETFAPRALREEALLVTIALGIVVAVIPEVTAGWQSALALNRESASGSVRMIANWVLALSASSALLGGLHTLLRRR